MESDLPLCASCAQTTEPSFSGRVERTTRRQFSLHMLKHIPKHRLKAVRMRYAWGIIARYILLAATITEIMALGLTMFSRPAMTTQVGTTQLGSMRKNLVLYLVCNADELLGATVSARSALDNGLLADIGVLAVREYLTPNETRFFESLSLSAQVFWVDEIDNPALDKMSADDLQNAKQCRYTKIHAWKMEQYDRVLLLDTDTLVMANLDGSFEDDQEEDLLAVRDPVGDVFNSGVLLLRPNKTLAGSMMRSKDELESYNRGDQGFFNSFFGANWARLPSKYNVLIQSVDSLYVRAGLPESVSVLHFTAELKPWNFYRASTVKTGWKTGKVPWEWYAKWHQMADSNDERYAECFSERTMSGLSRTKNDSSFAVMISTYDRPEASLAKVVSMFESVAEASEIIIVSRTVGRKLDTKALQQATTKKLRVLYQKSGSGDGRFFAELAFHQGAVFVCDDDISVPPKELSFAHSIFKEHKQQITGFLTRVHRHDGSYMSNGTRMDYSLMRSKGMFIAPDYLFAYACLAPKRSLEMVDRNRECEDVLMNFVVAGISGKAPVTVKMSEPFLEWEVNEEGGMNGSVTAEGFQDEASAHSWEDCIGGMREEFGTVNLQHSGAAYMRLAINATV